jgi:hypothetical protein
MTVPPAHVTDVDIERFQLRQLPPEALVTFADHLASCGECRRRVAGRSDAAAASGSLHEALGIAGDDHVTESEIQAFVDGGLDADRRSEISTHLAQCLACAEEVRDLEAFAAQFRRTARFQRPWTYGALAAAAVLVLGVAFTLLSRTQGPRRVAVLADATGEVTLDSQGTLAGVGALAPADRDRVRDALETGRLAVPPTISELMGRRGALMGSADAPGFHLVSPIGTVVLGTRPTLQWTPLPDATTYIVTLQDQSSGETISSPPVARTQWAPGQPLVGGRTYAWQVAASGSGKEIVVPKPPDPPARFIVVDASEAGRLERLPASHLVRGVLYANAGLLDDAERELAALSAQNPNSEVADRLLKQIRGFRP